MTHETRATYKGAIILEVGGDKREIDLRLKGLLHCPDTRVEIIILCKDSDRALIQSSLDCYSQHLSIVVLDDKSNHFSQITNRVSADRIAFLQHSSYFDSPAWDDLPANIPSLMPWLSATPIPPVQAQKYPSCVIGWIASRQLLERLCDLGPLSCWTTLNLAEAARKSGGKLVWPSITVKPAISEVEKVRTKDRELTSKSSVLALVPHYKCETWLAACLESLVEQTRPLDGIAVIDDHSGSPPVDIVRRFPQVSLLETAENVGPYRIIQTIINNTNYDAYLFQDADDWSSYDRLELLLAEAEKTGAELIGCQELRIFCDTSRIIPVCYPVDVNAALGASPSHSLLHPTSLVSRSLAQRIGGYPTGLRFGGDSEFLLRAAYSARVVNLQRYCYFRRFRPGSLTSSPDTGADSPARQALQSSLRSRARKNAADKAKGRLPDLTPFAIMPPIELTHVAGPPLRGR
jgi:Glycosyl transferase family 2